MLLNARTAAARSASFFHHLQASRCGSIRSALSLLHDANEESSLVCSVSITESSCRVRPSKGFCWQGHRGRIDSRCVGQHNGNVALPEGQMEAQSVSKALSQVELLMQQGSRMTAVAQVIYPCFMCISSLLFSDKHVNSRSYCRYRFDVRPFTSPQRVLARRERCFQRGNAYMGMGCLLPEDYVLSD